MPTDALRLIAYDRAYVLPRAARHENGALLKRPRGFRHIPRGAHMLTVAVVTRRTEGQPMALAVLRHDAYQEGRWCLVEETLAAGDEVTESERRFLTTSRLRVFTRHQGAQRRIIAPIYEAGMMLVGWDLPFVLSRFARDVRTGRSETDRHLTLDLTGLRWDPRVKIHAWDGTHASICWQRYKGYRAREPKVRCRDGTLRECDVLAGDFLDVKRHASMYSPESLTPGEACELLPGVPVPPEIEPVETITPELVAALREQARCLHALAASMLREWNRVGGVAVRLPAARTRRAVPGEIFPTACASNGSLIKAALEGMGIPRNADTGVSPEWMGRAMAAYKGGRVESLLPGMIIPARYVDLWKAYSTCGTLIGASDHLTAERIAVEPCLMEARALAAASLDDLLRRKIWRRIGMVLCRIRSRGSLIPVASRYVERGDAVVAINPTWAEDRWVMLADVIAGHLMGGPLPEILEAVRFVPGPRRSGLRSMRFRGAVLDPAGDLFAQLLSEQRRAKASGEQLWASFLKITENSLYGIFAEYHETASDAAVTDVWDGTGHKIIPLLDRHRHRRLRREESPGPYLRPHLAAGITATVRLLLAMLQAMVESAGGTITYMDTDSAVIAASEKGGWYPARGGPHRAPDGRSAIKLLRYVEVDAILERFRSLSPIGGPVWELEDENTPPADATSCLLALAYGPKRHALFYDLPGAALHIAKATAHSITCLPPQGMTRHMFLTSAWGALIRFERGDREAIRALPYAREVAIGVLPLRSAHVFRQVRQALEGTGVPVTPFGMLLVAQQAASLFAFGFTADEGLPIAPWTPDPLRAHWISPRRGCPVEVVPMPETDEGFERLLAVHTDRRPVLVIATYADVLRQHRGLVEHKYATPNGREVTHGCGLLHRHPVCIEHSVAMGKESLLADEMIAGVILPKHAEPIYEPQEPADNEHLEALREVLPVLREIPMSVLVKRTKRTDRALRAIRNGKARPRAALAEALLKTAAWWERHHQLRGGAIC